MLCPNEANPDKQRLSAGEQTRSCRPGPPPISTHRSLPPWHRPPRPAQTLYNWAEGKTELFNFLFALEFIRKNPEAPH